MADFEAIREFPNFSIVEAGASSNIIDVLQAEDLNYIVVMENDSNDPPTPADADQIYEFDVENEMELEREREQKRQKLNARLYAKKVLLVKPLASGVNEEEDVFKCPHCDYVTAKRHLLRCHLKSHSDDWPFKCAVCERGFKAKASLENHLNKHLGRKPHSCTSCDSSFTTSGELNRHTRYEHTKEKPHVCTECDYSSVELSKLQRHMRCHTGEKPYQCPHCTYASSDNFGLKRHMRTHTGEKPYVCVICDARFTQSNSLKAHNRIHLDTKPVFQCTKCPTKCGRAHDLRLHEQNLHHSEKPIPCKRCGMELQDRYSYKMHIKTHEGKKCYRWEHCNMGFRQRPMLTSHLNLNHKKNYVPPKPCEKMHSCPECKRTFNHKGNRIRHMETHDPTSLILSNNTLEPTVMEKDHTGKGFMGSAEEVLSCDKEESIQQGVLEVPIHNAADDVGTGNDDTYNLEENYGLEDVDDLYIIDPDTKERIRLRDLIEVD